MRPGSDQVKLAAIVFTDIVGYSALVHRDAALGKRLLDRQRAVVRGQLGVFGGREVETAGDSFLLLFDSTMTALACVAAIQRALSAETARSGEAVELRTSIHLGEIEIRSDGIYGDGVNIAARILPYSPYGGVAVSDIVQRQLKSRLTVAALSIGTPALKNIEQPVEIYTLDATRLLAVDTRPPEALAPEAVHPALYTTQTGKGRGEERGATLIWRFGQAEFDERALELSVGGTPVELERKPLEVLRHLLWHAGEVVTRDELLDAVWPGRVLTESVITKCISRLREVLGDTDQEIIKTAHGYGYRLVAEVSVKHPKSGLPAPRFAFQPGDSPPLRPSWKLVERLGSGGHGEAWLAEHEKTRDKRVYKFAFDEGALVALKREITLYRLLRDTLGERADFVRILDWNLSEAPCFTEAEYVPGGNLLVWAEALGGLAVVPLATRLELAAQVAATLAATHAVGVLHKDLKPGNVLISGTDAPAIKLMDFGSGGVINPQQLDQLGITRMGFTQVAAPGSEVTSGTPLYLAPEVIAGHPVTVQSDIYALGIMLYQLVVGDLRKPLAPGWEQDVDDELLREDIAAAANGNPQGRLTDAGLLADRLRSLEQRRAERAAERQRRVDEARALEAAEHTRHENDKLRARRTGLIAAAAILLIALLVSTSLYLEARSARGQAERKQAQAEAMADFLQYDLLTIADPENNDLRRLEGLTALLDAALPLIDERLGKDQLVATKVRQGFAQTYWNLGHTEMAFAVIERMTADVEAAIAQHHPDALEMGVSTYFWKVGLEPLRAIESAVTERWTENAAQSLIYHQALAAAHLVAEQDEPALSLSLKLLEDAKAATPDNAAEAALVLLARSMATDHAVSILTGRYEDARAGELCADLLNFVAASRRSTTAIFASVVGRCVFNLLDLKRFELAEELIKKVRTEYNRTYAQDHRESVILQYHLGGLRMEQGRTAEAREIFEALPVDWNRYPRIGRMYLFDALHDAGSSAKAMAGLRQEILYQQQAPDDEEALPIARAQLVEQLLETGRTAEALVELAQLPDSLLEKRRNSTGIIAMADRYFLGLLAGAQGQPEEAARLFGEAWEAAEKTVDRDRHWARKYERAYRQALKDLESRAPDTAP